LKKDRSIKMKGLDMKKINFGILIAGMFLLSFASAQDFSVDITASNGDTTSVDLTFGMTLNATDGFDDGLDTYAPPAPPSGFDAALTFDGDRYYIQMLAPSTDPRTMGLQFQEPYSFSWDPSNYADAGSFTLIDPFGGAFVNIDMTVDGYIDITTHPFLANLSTLNIDFTASESQPAQPVTYSGPDLTASPGDIIGYPVQLQTGGNELGAYQFNITADPSVMNKIEVIEGDIIPSSGWVNNETDLGGGTFVFGGFATGGDPIATDGDLLIISYEISSSVAPGTYSVVFSNESAGDYNTGLDLGTATVDGSITIEAPPPGSEPTADFSASPLSGYAPLDVSFTDLSTPGESGPSGFALTVMAASAGGTEQSLTFGMDLNTTDGFDDGVDTYAPPAPPSGFDAALFWNNDRYFVQMVAPSSEPTTMGIQFQDLYSFSWDPASFGTAGSFTLIDPFGGAFVNVDMTQSGYVGVDTHPFLANLSSINIDFTANPIETPANGSNDLRAGDIISWSWEFGDGGTSSEQNPSHTYFSPGTYSVTLTVTDEDGLSGSFTAFDMITVDAGIPPTADFTANPTSGIVPLDVNFSDASDMGTGSNPTWDWDFNDDGVTDATGPGPHTWTYINPGFYNAKLILSTTHGSSSATQLIEAIGLPDLVVSDMAVAGDYSSINVTISNIGDSDSPGYYGTDWHAIFIDGAGYEFYEDGVAVPAGGSHTYTIGLDLLPGDHNITVQADYYNDVMESDENNNSGSVDINVPTDSDAVQNVAAEAGENEVILTWDEVDVSDLGRSSADLGRRRGHGDKIQKAIGVNHENSRFASKEVTGNNEITRSDDNQLMGDPDFTVTLNAGGSDGTQVPLMFGMAPGATDDYDDGLDEYAPPFPPSGFAAALSWNNDSYFTQIITPDTVTALTMGVAFQEPFSFSWDPVTFAEVGSFTLIDPFGGAFVNVDMTVGGYIDVATHPFLANLTSLSINFTAFPGADPEPEYHPNFVITQIEYDAENDTLSIEISNWGDADSEGWDDGNDYHNLTVGSYSTYITNPALAAGESASWGFALYDLLGAGTYTASVTADVDNDTEEWDEDDNYAAIGLTVLEQAMPDLVVSSLTFDEATMELSYTVENIDAGDAGPFYVGVWINNENYPIHCGAPYGDLDNFVDGLPSGGSVSFTDNLSALPPGDFEIYVTVDNDCWVEESFEDNNVAGPVTFTIEPPPTANYTIYMNDGTGYVVAATGIEGNSYTVTGLQNYMEYCFYITATLPDGTVTPPSLEVCATPYELGAHFSFDSTAFYQPIILVSLSYMNAELEDGDEIGAFDGDLCVGAVEYNSTNPPEFFQAWADDGFTPQLDGFIEGNTISFRYWDKSEATEINPLTIDYTPFNGWDTSGEFSQDAITGVELSTDPRVDDIPDQTIDEDLEVFASINLDDYVNDPDDGDAGVTWTADGQQELIVTINGGSATVDVPYEHWNGSENITFTATDPNGAFDSDAAAFTVNAVDDAPEVADIEDQTVDEGGTFATFDLDDYLTEHDGDAVTWSFEVTTGRSESIKTGDDDIIKGSLDQDESNSRDYLTVTIDENNVVTVTIPDDNWHGSETFEFIATDDTGNLLFDSDPATFTVNPVNDEPVLTDIDDQTVEEDFYSVTIGLSASDVDDGEHNPGDENVLTFTATSDNSNITTSVSASSLTISAEENYNGSATITVTVTDDGDLSDSGDFVFTINAVNDAPVAEDDSYSTDEGGTITGNVTDNDSDIDATTGDVTPDEHFTLSVSLVNDVDNGTLSLNADGSFTYTHDGGESTSDEFVYELADGAGGSDQATVSIEIISVNDPPVAMDDAYNVEEDGELVSSAPGVLGNDYDYDGDGLTAELANGTTNGTLSLNADGSFTYSPNANYYGPDSFTYQAYDGQEYSNTATVSITVNPVDDPIEFIDEYPDVDAIVGQLYNFTAATEELDDDFIDFYVDFGTADFLSVTVINDGSSDGYDGIFDVDTVEYLISGTPGLQHVGTHNILLDFGDGTTIVSLDYILTVRQSFDYDLEENWSWRSFPVTELEPKDGLEFFGDVLGSLTAVLSYPSGELYQIPDDGWYNSIDYVNPHSGYVMKMNEDATLTKEGSAVPVNDPLDLNSWWNWIGYYGSEAPDAYDAFYSLITEGVLVIAMSYDGILIHLPDDTWLNTIGSLEYTDGYIIKLTDDFPGFQWQTEGAAPPSDDNLISTRTDEDPEYFNFTKTQMYEPIVLMIEGEGLEAGAEFAAFTGNMCIGASVYDPAESDVLQLLAWEDDPYTDEVDGFVSGDNITLKVWTGEHELTLTDIEFIEFENWDASGMYNSGSIAGVVIDLDGLGIDQLGIPQQIALHNNYPNPFNPTTTIKYDLTGDAMVSLEIYDVMGREIRTLVNNVKSAGYHEAVWDAMDNSNRLVPSGVYIYRLTVNGSAIDTRKMIMIK